MQSIGIIGAVGDHLAGSKPLDQTAGRCHVVFLTGPISKRTGRPRASTKAWSLVPSLPRERPRA